MRSKPPRTFSLHQALLRFRAPLWSVTGATCRQVRGDARQGGDAARSKSSHRAAPAQSLSDAFQPAPPSLAEPGCPRLGHADPRPSSPSVGPTADRRRQGAPPEPFGKHCERRLPRFGVRRAQGVGSQTKSKSGDLMLFPPRKKVFEHCRTSATNAFPAPLCQLSPAADMPSQKLSAASCQCTKSLRDSGGCGPS